ncbi:hypothetical protein B1759_01000 [Rubrivirga sp. SAORIC476]|nr:hypothetical protein B1759_01000 [Rubrivirga sp. SAORIC476]
MVRVPRDGGDADTLYSSEVFFDLDLVDDTAVVTTCSRNAETGIAPGKVEVIVDEDFDCRTNRPILARK